MHLARWLFLQLAARGSVGNSIQMQSGELAQSHCFIQRFFHCRVAVAEPVLRQVHPQHSDQRIRQAAPHLSDNAVRSKRSTPSKARPGPSRSGKAHDGFAYAYLHTQHWICFIEGSTAQPFSSCYAGHFIRFANLFQSLPNGPHRQCALSSTRIGYGCTKKQNMMLH